MEEPSGRYVGISAGGYHSCAVREDGGLSCWGFGWAGQTNAPPGRYRQVSAGVHHSCGGACGWRAVVLGLE